MLTNIALANYLSRHIIISGPTRSSKSSLLRVLLETFHTLQPEAQFCMLDPLYGDPEKRPWVYVSGRENIPASLENWRNLVDTRYQIAKGLPGTALAQQILTPLYLAVDEIVPVQEQYPATLEILLGLLQRGRAVNVFVIIAGYPLRNVPPQIVDAASVIHFCFNHSDTSLMDVTVDGITTTFAFTGIPQ